MPEPITAGLLVGGSIASSVMSGRESRKGAEKAAKIQASAEREGLAALRSDLESSRRLGDYANPAMIQSLWGYQGDYQLPGSTDEAGNPIAGTFLPKNEFSSYSPLTAEQLLSDPFYNELSRQQDDSVLAALAILGWR